MSVDSSNILDECVCGNEAVHTRRCIYRIMLSHSLLSAVHHSL